MNILLGPFLILWRLILVAAIPEGTELDLLKDVVYEPANAWHHVNMSLNGRNCGDILMDHYTTTIGANMTFQITGTTLIIFGLWKRTGGVLRVFMDDTPVHFEEGLYAEEEACWTIYEGSMMVNRTRTVVVNLYNVTLWPHDWKPPHPPQPGPLELHITSIRYWAEDYSLIGKDCPQSVGGSQFLGQNVLALP